MGLLDGTMKVTPSGGQMPVTFDGENTRRTEHLITTSDYEVRAFRRLYNEEKVALVAFDGDLAVFCKNTNTLYFSTNGIDGDLSDAVSLNSSTFPGIIDGSKVQHVAIIRYQRMTSGTVRRFNGRDYRVNVFTNKGQIFHNFPSRATDNDGAAVDGDFFRWEESCIWDLPNRKTPVKTTVGNDATLISTGAYKYLPCLPDACYEMHPMLNTDNQFADPYGNGGFGATFSCKDEDGNSVVRPRLFTICRDNEQAIYTVTLSGLYQDRHVSVFTTYRSNLSNLGTRMCVFATNDGGRQWFVQYEFGSNGLIVERTEGGDRVINGAWDNFSTFNESSMILHFNGGSMTSSSAFILKKRSQYAPNSFDKEPEKTAKFKYGNGVAIASISDTNDGLLVTTSSAHGLANGDVLVIEKTGNDSTNWDWIASVGHTQMGAGNGTLWKARVVTTTSFYLETDVHNPDNNLTVRHIHTVNRCKDGYIVGCGEAYPYGWIMYWPIKEGDSFGDLNVANLMKFIRLTSTSKSVYRTLGMQLYDDKDTTILTGLDHCLIERDDVVMPEGRTDTFDRSSSGVFRGRLQDIDDIDSLECVFETCQPAYFFKEIDGICIFVGMQGKLGISKDRGNTWFEYQLPPDLSSRCVLIGRSTDKTVGINYFDWGSDTLLIKSKV